MWRSSTKWVLMYAQSIFRFQLILNVLFILISTLKTIFIKLKNWKNYHQFSGIILYLNSIKSEFSSSIYSKLSDVHYDSFFAGASPCKQKIYRHINENTPMKSCYLSLNGNNSLLKSCGQTRGKKQKRATRAQNNGNNWMNEEWPAKINLGKSSLCTCFTPASCFCPGCPRLERAHFNALNVNSFEISGLRSSSICSEIYILFLLAI